MKKSSQYDNARPVFAARLHELFSIRQNRPAWIIAGGAAIILVLLLLGGGLLVAPHLVLLTAQMIGILAVLMLGLCYVGFGATWVLRERSMLPMLPLFTPVIGAAVLSAIGHALGYLPVGTYVTIVPILLAITLLNIWAWRQGARPRISSRSAPGLLVLLIGLAMGMLPVYIVGDLTTVGGMIDAINYVTTAEYLRHDGVMFQFNADQLAMTPLTGWMQASQNVGFRRGDVFILSLFTTALGLRAYLVFPMMMAVWYGLTALSAYVFAAFELRLNRWVAVAAGGFVALQPLLHFVILDTFFSQAAGIGIWIFTMLAIVHALRPTGTWRAVVLAGLLAGTLITFYHVYIFYTVAIAGPMACYEWWRSSRARLSGLPRGHALRARLGAILGAFWPLFWRGIGMIAASLALMPVGWIIFWKHIVFLQTLVRLDGTLSPITGVSTPRFPHPGEIVGIVSHMEGVLLLELPQTPAPIATGLLVVVVAIMLYGIWRMRGRQRALLAIGFIMLTLALLHMRFGFEDGAGYPYGYFKVISFSAPLAGVLFVNGLWQMGRDARRLPGQAPLLVQSAAMLLFAGISLLATFHMVVTAHHTATQRTFAHPGTLEVQEIRSLIPPDEPLLIIDPRHVYQLWTAYLIDHPQMFFRVRPHTYAAPPQVASHAFIKYAIIAQKGRATPGGALPDEPWFSEETTEVLWESADYVLVRRTDQVIADMPLSISSRHLSLHTPTTLHLSEDTLHIEGAFAERPPHLSQPITQTLAGRPTHVSIITESSEGGGLHITYSNGDEETYSLVASRQRFVLEVDVPVTLQLSQFSAGTVWVLDVRVIGQEGP